MADQPDLSRILEEIQGLRAAVEDHGGRIGQLEQWQIATQAAEAAIAKYKRENPPLPVSERRTIFGEGVNTELIKIIVQALGIIGGIVAAGTLALQYLLK